jgi:hypothetical protein
MQTIQRIFLENAHLVTRFQGGKRWSSPYLKHRFLNIAIPIFPILPNACYSGV